MTVIQPNAKGKLEMFLEKHPSQHVSFKNTSRDHYRSYQQVAEYLARNIHSWVNTGAAVAGGENDRGEHVPILLTDHGASHIDKVIDRAGDLTVGGETPLLTPYECYILLLAIQFHDVGNIYGREEHEKKITEIISGPEITAYLGEDTIERRLIRDIAMAHGGVANGSKDTIRSLQYDRLYDPKKDVRVHLLAAILRFADELSEDFTRTSRFLDGCKLVQDNCKIYHRYADRLRRVAIKAEDHLIELTFQINATTAAETFDKGGENVYLIDEIQKRLLKMHKEHIYCNRYLRPFVAIDSIRVKIELCVATYMNVLETISFTMQEQGYPDSPAQLGAICPTIGDLTGIALHKRFQNFGKGAV